MTIDPNGFPATPRAVWSQVFHKNGATLITWKPAAYDDKIAHAAREQLLLALDGLTPAPRKPRARKPDPGALEKAGEAALKDLAKREAPKRPWIVRVYYRSEDGSQCYAEFGGLTEAEATTCHSYWSGTIPRAKWDGKTWVDERDTRPEPQIWSVKRRTEQCRSCCGTGGAQDPEDIAMWKRCETCEGKALVDEPIPAPKRGWRKVVFPSERQDEVAWSCPECGKEGPCASRCSVAPWNLSA